jgi:hypothetical protein
MNKRERRIERQKQNRLEKLGTNDPVCTTCGHDHWACFDNHHIAGRRYLDTTVRLCKNCHAEVTALQKGHSSPEGKKPSTEEIIGRLLLGLADFFELLIDTLREFGEYLIEKARSVTNAGEEPSPETSAT